MQNSSTVDTISNAQPLKPLCPKWGPVCGSWNFEVLDRSSDDCPENRSPSRALEPSAPKMQRSRTVFVRDARPLCFRCGALEFFAHLWTSPPRQRSAAQHSTAVLDSAHRTIRIDWLSALGEALALTVLYRSLYLPTQLSILSLVDVAAKIASNRRTERQNSRTRLVLSAKIDHGYHPRSTYESVSGVTGSGP
jgi:hypothetical protein